MDKIEIVLSKMMQQKHAYETAYTNYNKFRADVTEYVKACDNSDSQPALISSGGQEIIVTRYVNQAKKGITYEGLGERKREVANAMWSKFMADPLACFTVKELETLGFNEYTESVERDVFKFSEKKRVGGIE